METNYKNPPKSPFFKGGLTQAQACGFQSLAQSQAVWEPFPPFSKGGSGGILFSSDYPMSPEFGGKC